MNANEWLCHELYEQDVKPNTNLLWIQVDYDLNKPELDGTYIKLTIEEWEVFINDDNKYYKFYAPVYTSEYATKASEAIDYQLEIQNNVDSIRNSDDQYEDPALWDANERLDLYLEKDLQTILFWKYDKN